MQPSRGLTRNGSCPRAVPKVRRDLRTRLHNGSVDIDLSCPAVLIQSTDLLAIDRRRENRGDNFELLDAIVLVASIHRYLTHQELLGVCVARGAANELATGGSPAHQVSKAAIFPPREAWQVAFRRRNMAAGHRKSSWAIDAGGGPDVIMAGRTSLDRLQAHSIWEMSAKK